MKNVRLLISSALCVFGFLANSNAQIIEIMRPFAGTGATSPFTDNVAATAGTMNNQYMINLDATGTNLYIADNGDNRVRRVDLSTGIITTVAGTGTSGSSGDGGPATAALLGGTGGGLPGVVGVCADGSGNVFIADGSNHKIRKVDATGIITTIGGTGTPGFAGDGAAATLAQIRNPRGIWVDGTGNIYFSEGSSGGGSTLRIRRIDGSTGIITTVAGNGSAGFTADGVVATTSSLNNPRGLVVDGSGNIYIADFGNNRVRRVDGTTNIITTVAGTGTGGYSGEGLAATASRLNTPLDVKMDGAGNLYIADNANSRVRKVDMSTGLMTTVAGSGTAGNDAGNWGPATASGIRLASLSSIAVMNNGNYFFISDRQGGGGSTGNRVKHVRPNSVPYFTGGTRQSFSVCEDQSAFNISSLLGIIDSDQVQIETWSLGTWAPLHGTTVLTGTAAANGGTVTPTGKTYTPTPGYSGMDSFIVQISDGYDISTDTLIVTINPLPIVPAIAGLDNVCEGSNTVLTNDSTGGAWAASNANATVVGGTVTGVTAGTVNISYTRTNTCGSRTVIKAMTINPLPNAGSISGGTYVCVGSNITLTDAAPGGTWTASNSNATVVGGTVTGASVGTVAISYTVVNACGTASASQTVTVDAIPSVAAIAGANNVCVAATTLLTDATGGGTWSASNTNATVSGGLVTGVSAGSVDISYSVTNGCGTTAVAKTMTINPLADAGTISGSPNVCIAGTTTLTDASPGGSWSASNSNATVSGGVVTGVTVGTTIISYSVTNSCGTAVATFNMNIISSPTAGVITGPTNVCPAASIALSDGVGGGVWSMSNGNATITGGGVVTGVTAGMDTVSYTVIVSCGSATATYVITVDPLPDPGVIVGASNVCVGATTTLTDASVGGTWSSSSTSVATVSSGGLVTGITGGLTIISYSVTNVCGTLSALKNVTVSPNVVPSVTFTASPGFNTCPGTLVTYSAVPVNGGSSPTYSWRVNGFTLGAGAAFNHTPSNGDVIAVTMTSSAACVIPTSDDDSIVVVVNPTLVPAVSITTGLVGDTVCVGTITTYSATPVNGGTTPAYTWFVNSTPVSAGNPFTYIPNNGDIVSAQLTSSYACPSPGSVMSNNITMTVDVTETPAVTITVSPGSPVCTGTAVVYTAHPLYGGVPPFFRWTKNGVNVATGPTYVMIPANGDNVFCMLASSVSCRTADSVFSNHIVMATQNPVPVTVTISQTSSVIGIGGIDVFTATVTSAALAPTYQWYVNGSLVSGATSSSYIVVGTTPGTQTVNCVAGSGDVCYTTGTSNVLTVTTSTSGVGVNDVNNDAYVLRVVPNPNKGVFTINMPSAVEEPVHVIITNVLGEKVKEFTTTSNKDVEVSLNQAAGIYLVSATTEHSKYVTKVIVE